MPNSPPSCGQSTRPIDARLVSRSERSGAAPAPAVRLAALRDFDPAHDRLGSKPEYLTNAGLPPHWVKTRTPPDGSHVSFRRLRTCPALARRRCRPSSACSGTVFGAIKAQVANDFIAAAMVRRMVDAVDHRHVGKIKRAHAL
jgi:hypothetical protein